LVNLNSSGNFDISQTNNGATIRSTPKPDIFEVAAYVGNGPTTKVGGP